jgi:hypothetical protein
VVQEDICYGELIKRKLWLLQRVRQDLHVVALRHVRMVSQIGHGVHAGVIREMPVKEIINVQSLVELLLRVAVLKDLIVIIKLVAAGPK